jgi:hypothetical protein
LTSRSEQADDIRMSRPRVLAATLVAVAVVGTLTAAAFSGSSEARSFAKPGSLACVDNPEPRPTPIPTQEITPENLSEFSRVINAWQSEKNRLSTDRFITDRVSMASAPRAESVADRFVLPSFEETVATAERVVTGTVVDQRLQRRTLDSPSQVALVSQLDGDGARVTQAVFTQCGATLMLVYYSWEPALVPGERYALVLDSSDLVLLAYQLSGGRMTPLYPTDGAPLGAQSSVEGLIAAIQD